MIGTSQFFFIYSPVFTHPKILSCEYCFRSKNSLLNSKEWFTISKLVASISLFTSEFLLLIFLAWHVRFADILKNLFVAEELIRMAFSCSENVKEKNILYVVQKRLRLRFLNRYWSHIRLGSKGKGLLVRWMFLKIFIIVEGTLFGHGLTCKRLTTRKTKNKKKTTKKRPHDEEIRLRPKVILLKHYRSSMNGFFCVRKIPTVTFSDKLLSKNTFEWEVLLKSFSYSESNFNHQILYLETCYHDIPLWEIFRLINWWILTEP